MDDAKFFNSRGAFFTHRSRIVQKGLERVHQYKTDVPSQVLYERDYIQSITKEKRQKSGTDSINVLQSDVLVYRSSQARF